MRHFHIKIESFESDGEVIIGNIDTIINITDRIAIVGRNGIGKSTLLRIVSGEITEYKGNIENAGSIELGYLEQIHFLDGNKTIHEELRDAFREVRLLEKKIQEEEEKLGETGEYEAYIETLEQYKIRGGYTYEGEIDRVARGIGIYHLLENTLDSVSGGERTKVALAKTLLSKPEFLLLDEPTNFIDLSSVEWLEKYLRETWKGGYMIVSHDREFLDKSVTKVIEILGPSGIHETIGDYSFSVEEKEKQSARDLKKYEEQQAHRESEQMLINRFRAGSRAGFAKSREKMLEREELLEKPIYREEISFQFSTPKVRAPANILKIEEAFIGRKDPLFFIREASLGNSDRIGIIGENGVGKSTFLKTIMSAYSHEEDIKSVSEGIKVLEGYLQVAKGLQIGYYSQMHESLDPEKTIEENFIGHGFHYTKERIGSILKSYGFGYHDGDRKVSGLSGGERSRLLFALLCQREYHILILDEPTNHLDYETRESLEKALKKYEGTLLFISHDRYFINKISEKLWIIEDGDLIISYGSYDDYQYKKEHGISLDMSLFDAEGEMELVLQEKLGATEARRIKEKFARKRK